jgi:esterase/lipase superfamily enzyme
MKKVSRRLLYTLAAVLLVALALVPYFSVKTRRALERAEALRFHRMHVTQQGEDGLYRFFYVTNRTLDGAPEDSEEFEEQFGAKREPGLKFGRFDMEIQPSLGVGLFVDSTNWFLNEELQMREVRALERDAFVAGLREQVERSPRRSLLVSINGFRERFPSALRKTAFLAHMLDIDTPHLVFDWPGNQGSSLRGYQRAQRIAAESGAELAATLELILKEVRPERLWLVANSMGGEVVVNAFELLYQQPELADLETEIEDVVLTAPDVCHEQWGRQFAEEISSLATNLTVYVSSNDRALLMSRVINRGRRLGESRVNPSNPDQADSAARALELLQPGSAAVTLVDVTPINRTRNFHNFSLETPEFFDDLFMRLTNEQTPLSRAKYAVETPNGTQYWVLTRGH